MIAMIPLVSKPIYSMVLHFHHFELPVVAWPVPDHAKHFELFTWFVLELEDAAAAALAAFPF